MTIALSPRTRQRLAGWTCVLSYAWALLAPIAHAGRVLPLEGTGRYTQRDALNRPLTITDDGGTPSTTADDRVTTYGYDLAGRALTLTQPNGTRSVNTYDKAGRLKTRTLKAPNNSTLAVFSWQHDALGNVKQQTEDWLPGATSPTARQRSTDMSYDDGGRLWTETVTETGAATVTTTYTYDAAHNRKRKVVTGGTGAGTWDMDYNSYNQLISMTKTVSGSVTETVTYSYDLNGNRTQTRRVVGTGWSKITIYRWNAWDKLIGVQMPDTRAYTYTYDYRTRRVGTAQDDTMGLVAKHTAVVFSGGLSVAEFERATNTALNSAVPAVQYVRGPDMGGGVGGLLFTVRNPVNNSGWPIAPTTASPLKLRHNLSDGRGDIVAQCDGGGALTWTASYEAYGKRTKETGTNADKQRANTKDEDPTGLLNEGFRYRDIETGVWLSRDPAGFVDGPNLYAYVMQNPWSKWDPDGLWWRDALSTGLDFIPGVSTIKSTVEFVAGQDLITGEAISRAESAASLGASFIPGGKGALKIAKMGAKMADKAFELNGKADAVIAVAGDIAEGDVGLDTLMNAASMRGGKGKGDGGPRKDGGGGNCFPAGTSVLTDDGLVPIESLNAGDYVLAYDFETNAIVSREVEETLANFTYNWVDVTLEDQTVTATRMHRFWVESKSDWVYAIDLQVGDLLRSADGSIKGVKNVLWRQVNEPEATYNLEVANNHNFFVGPCTVLVHNGDIRKEDIDDGPHGPNRPMETVRSRALNGTPKMKDQGRWNSAQSAIDAMSGINDDKMITGQGYSTPIPHGAGTVVKPYKTYPDRGNDTMEVDAKRAFLKKDKDGKHHTFPIDEGHRNYGDDAPLKRVPCR
jgi:RHS repeat-associated protein